MGRERRNEKFSTVFRRCRKLKSFFYGSEVVEECCVGVEEANLISMSDFFTRRPDCMVF